MKTKERTLTSCQKIGVVSKVWNVNLWTMLGSLLQVVM
jgi:hypothetical protein